MSAPLPLLAHTDPERPLAWRPEGPIPVGQFLADVRATALRLPANRYLLNLCADRYRFAVGLAAGMLAGRISLLPSSHTPETLRQLQLTHPDLLCLDDQAQASTGLPTLHLQKAHYPLDPIFAVPQIDPAATVAQVFTSGSTGLPVPHGKTWGKLVGNVLTAAKRLSVGDSPHHFVGTVPAQHMYGFESTLLLPLLTGGAFWAGRPFYPADIADALAAVAEPRYLVTTPLHLRTLLDAGIALPAINGLLSATAPLSVDLARRAETTTGAKLQEIYGCTETGQLASRQPTLSSEWTLFESIAIEQQGDASFASGPHIEGRIALGDLLERTAEHRFILHGRSADLINIAGKRTSLAYLNHQLSAIPGVLDGAFYYPDHEAVDGVTRLAACVVAPTLDRRTVERALRERIEAVFLPRPLYLVDALPRNATGKLPRPLLAALIAGLDLRAAENAPKP
jgi:acyl-coenzyme A synthetase/AMP-(fatty) acid ligase